MSTQGPVPGHRINRIRRDRCAVKTVGRLSGTQPDFRGRHRAGLDAVSAAAATGAASAVELILKIAGLMCLWSGVMELVSASGLAGKIERLLRPALRLLFGSAAKDRKAMELVSANVTANLLGLSNAATPIGLQAVSRLYDHSGAKGSAGRGARAYYAEHGIHSTYPIHGCCGARRVRRGTAL